MKSAINDRHTVPDGVPPYAVHLDEILSRRKKFHIVTDARGEPVYLSNRVMDVIEWLAMHGQFQYLMHGEGRSWVVSLTRSNDA